MDSSSPSTTLATCEYYCHVLNKYNDSELKAVVDVATGKALWRSSRCISVYKEIQVRFMASVGVSIGTCALAVLCEPQCGFFPSTMICVALCRDIARFSVRMYCCILQPSCFDCCLNVSCRGVAAVDSR